MKTVMSVLVTKAAVITYWSDGTRSVASEHKVEKVNPVIETGPASVVNTAVNLGCIGDFWDKTK